MRFGGALAAAALLASAGAAQAETWSCSLIEEGKPQVLKVTVVGGKASISDWRSRILSKFANGSGVSPATLIQNDSDALIVAVEPYASRQMGQMQDIGISIIAIDKKVEKLSYVTVSTAKTTEEIKGACTQ